ncbi:hypothetical protein CSC70_07625 [Pseudoxanthomonas kalamensis DSM 18571]|uniref:TonB-dependent receptor domain-containing protein n=1 Tax=Pseudoxanthomonas kalamensis TaxID=289483 RepID=UPI001390DE60|nr:TonB-dependent receptor [Pseudoxanthomonas kalamensis]KAF1710520.1 hypothetical protein CSC70_07625 [Pseudoxanthomonas kalamensis DSM 18571]
MKSKKPNHRRPTRKLLTCALASCLMLSAAPVAFAQSSNATLRGHAPTGAEVTATNTETGLTRRVTVGADGNYALVGLPPGTYQVDAGPGTEQTVKLAVATSVSLDLGTGSTTPAGDATTLATVSVTAPPLQEVKTSEVGTNVSLKQISTVPQLTRNFLEFADAVPGMQFNTASNGNASIRGGAQTTSAVNVYIDGVGQKSYLFGGVSGQSGSAGNPFPQLAIGEYKVITSNYKAEFDQVGSAAIIAQTKSGTNEFHGEVYGRHTDSSWRARTPAETQPGKDKPKTHQNEYGFALGGPIIQDKMHFFISYEGKGFVIPVDPVATGQNIAGIEQYLPAGVNGKLGPATRPFNEDLYFGKIDWDIGYNDRLELSAKLRREDARDNIGGTNTADASRNFKNDEDRFDLKWQHYGESYLNEFGVSYEKSFYNPTAYNIGNRAIYTLGTDQTKVILSDGAASGLGIQNKGQDGFSIKDDITFNSIEWFGDHVLKAGIKYKEVDLTQSENSVLNPSFYYAVYEGIGTDTTPYRVQFNLPYVGATPSVTTKDKQLGIYFQDDWNVNEHLQLNLGLRWDYEEIPSYLNYVTPDAVIDALTGPGTDPSVSATYAEQLAKGGIDINDYISNGHNRKADKNNFAPRLGFSYDINGDEAHVIFGGIGRSYDRNLYDYMGLEQVKSALAAYTILFSDTSGCTPAPNACAPFDPSYLEGAEALASLVDAKGRQGEADLINNDIKTPYSDQFSLGMRNRVGEWNTSAAVAYIHSKEGFVFTLGNRYPNGDFFQGGSQPWGHSPPGMGGSLIIGNNGIETKTTQLLLSAEKPYSKESGWGVTAAYTYSHAKGNRGGDEHYAFDGAFIGDYPFIDLAAVPEHRLVLTGIYDLPWEITASAKVILASPPPFNGIASGSYFDGIPRPVAVDAPGTFGTREVDLSLSKDMLITDDVTVQVRADLINAFNYDNLSSYNVNWGSGGVYDPSITYNRYGAQRTPPRTLFMSVRVIW